MGSTERKLRLKEETRINILQGALGIVKAEGWQSLRMRKIADVIEYTTPVIYEYFANKEAILLELTRTGFLCLGKKLKNIMETQVDPLQLMEGMWLAYWDFAFQEKELYQLMFGVDMTCANAVNKLPESDYPALLFKAAIKSLYGNDAPPDAEIASKYYTYWSIVHGLVSINMVNQGSSEVVNKHILLQSIMAINRSIKA